MTAQNATLSDSTNITHISKAVEKSEINSLYQVMDAADWYSATIFIANLTNFVHIDPVLADANMSFVDDSLPYRLGHRTMKAFVIKGRQENGLDLDWEAWKLNVKAARYKQTFGISSMDRDDVINQVEDVKSAIGRLPHSAVEFSIGVQRIQQLNIDEIEKEHAEQIGEMKSSVQSLMRQLNAEQKERHQAIERLNDALNQLAELSEQQKLHDQQQNEMMTEYVKKTMYENIIKQMEESETNFEETIQGYLDKILLLEKDKVTLTHQISSLKDAHSRAIQKLKSGQTEVVNQASRNEIVVIKQRLANILKAHVEEKTKNKKLHVISKKQKKLLTYYMQKHQEAQELEHSGPFHKLFVLAIAISSVALLSMAFYGQL